MANFFCQKVSLEKLKTSQLFNDHISGIVFQFICCLPKRTMNFRYVAKRPIILCCVILHVCLNSQHSKFDIVLQKESDALSMLLQGCRS